MAPELNASTFETALGHSALVWNGSGTIVGCILPEGARGQAEAELRRRYPAAGHAAAPAKALHMVDAVTAMLAGEPRTIHWSDLDFSLSPSLHQKVYALALEIAYGSTATYGDLARRLGDVSLAQAVGQALGANPIPILVPCHRVLGADGRIGGFSGGAGVETKVRLLNVERALPPDAAPLLFEALPMELGPRTRGER